MRIPIVQKQYYVCVIALHGCVSGNTINFDTLQLLQQVTANLMPSCDTYLYATACMFQFSTLIILKVQNYC